jgi:hypothetical protein
VHLLLTHEQEFILQLYTCAQITLAFSHIFNPSLIEAASTLFAQTSSPPEEQGQQLVATFKQSLSDVQ